MAQWVKVCVTKPDDQSWILGTHVVEGETDTHGLSSEFDTFAVASTHIN